MAYGQGNIITANDTPDFNSLRLLVNEVFSDTNSASTVEAVANFGYGKTAVSSVSPGDIITAAQWTQLFSAITDSALHQGTSIGIIPSSATPGDIITALDGPSGLVAIINDIRNNRLNVAVGQTSVTSSGSKLTSTRSTSWNNQLIHEFTVDFGSYDQARYFFNSGGQIRFSGSRTGGAATPQNTAWTNVLTNMGVVIMDHTVISHTGSNGTATAIGFYNLTNSYQTVFTANPAGTYYASDEYKVEARSDGVFGTTGVLRFRVSFTTAPGPDPVSGTISSFIDERRSVGAINIPSPTFTTITGLTSGS